MAGNEHATRAEPPLSRDGVPAEGPGPAVIHGTAVAIGDAAEGGGVLILGPSGAGKSGLALRLIALGAELVADDRVSLERDGDAVVARAPEALHGLIEARGVGILQVRARPSAEVRLVVDLAASPGARMPQCRKIALLGRPVGLIYGRGVPNLDGIITVLAREWGRASTGSG